MPISLLGKLYRSLLLAVTLPVATAAQDKGVPEGAPEAVTVVLLETSAGTVKVELDDAKAPSSVQNFLHYVNSGFYDGLIFHRVISGFMIQGGGFTPDMKQRTTTAPPIRNEADNGLKNSRGTIAMARTSDPHSATAQFFINLVDNGFLDHKSKTPSGWGYTVFGQVIEGMDVVDKIAQVPTGQAGPHRDVPKETITIRKAQVAPGDG